MCTNCGAWTETGKGTQLLQQCRNSFTEERKRAYDRVFKDGNTPNKNGRAKVLQIHVFDDKDEEMKDIRKRFEDKQKLQDINEDQKQQSNNRYIPGSHCKQEQDDRK